MHTTTLRGVFPEPKPVYRRNFIKENVKSIKQMQGLLQEVGAIQPRPARDDKYKNIPSVIRSRESSTPHTLTSLSQDIKLKVGKALKKTTIKSRLDRKKELMSNAVLEQEQKFTHRSMQTERTDNVAKLYETGVIKYPSPGVGRSKPTPRISSPPRAKGQGDSLEEEMQNLEVEEKDFVKANMLNFKSKQPKPVPPPKPSTYQRGVVPKYLRERKEDNIREIDDENCPEGHVLLPEEERKETLRVLRQSYADRIQELNSLPVRSDTLRIRKRKTELEEELKRIDGGIKVFQRPKVYVKINA